MRLASRAKWGLWKMTFFLYWRPLVRKGFCRGGWNDPLVRRYRNKFDGGERAFRAHMHALVFGRNVQ